MRRSISNNRSRSISTVNPSGHSGKGDAYSKARKHRLRSLLITKSGETICSGEQYAPADLPDYRPTRIIRAKRSGQFGYPIALNVIAAITPMFNAITNTYFAMNDPFEVLCLNRRMAHIPPGQPPNRAQTRRVPSFSRHSPFAARRLSHQIAMADPMLIMTTMTPAKSAIWTVVISTVVANRI